MDLPIARLDPSCVWNADIDAAAMGILGQLRKSLTEAGGVLYRNANGEYCYSKPITSSKDQHIEYKIALPKGMSVAGMYHTHPATIPELGGVFSPDDVQMADTLKVPSYIHAQADDEVRRYTPGVSKTIRNKVGKVGKGYISYGDLLGKLNTYASAE